ncbi:MAG: DUF2971 domain-containing protein [Methanosarcinales archaeon]|nr:DUF2971 domain-containing protein [Methanosarcinales archaeon]
MWKKEFVDLLYPTDPSKMNIDQAMILKYKNIPSSLFKYTSFSEKGYSILHKNKILLKTPDKFNDPFDCSLTFAMDPSRDAIHRKCIDNFKDELSESEIEELKKSDNPMLDLVKRVTENDPNIKKDQATIFADTISKSIEDEYNEMASRLSSGLKKGIYITCFSESKDSILMWSHYADRHRGFCIEYDFSSLDFHDTTTRLLYPIIYTDSLFDATEYLQPVFEGGEHNNLMVTYAAITKSTEWRYEKEWRYVLQLGPSNDPPLSVPKPKAIYLGAKVSEGDKENIIELANEMDIKVYQMAMETSEFKLIATDLL